MTRANNLAVAKEQGNAQVRAAIERGYWDIQGAHERAIENRRYLRLEHELQGSTTRSTTEARLRSEHEFEKEVRPGSLREALRRGYDWTIGK